MRWVAWILCSCLLLLNVPGWAAEADPQETALSEKLNRIFLGENPRGLDDLRAMQEHVQSLSKKLMPTIVGVRIGDAWGSGVLVSDDGYVLTAAHVAGKPQLKAQFVMHDGRILNGKTLGLNRTMDAGLMKITDTGPFEFAKLGPSDMVKDGQWCLAFGHPGGFIKDRGIVMRLGRVLVTDDSAITSDCPLVGGDSGGPLFDMNGRVIGINSRIAGAITSNLHVPVKTFRETWDRLVKADAWGHFPGQEPVLGVRGDKEAPNARVARVGEGSPAAKAGVLVGDIVTKFGDKEITKFSDLVQAVQEHQPNDHVRISLQRGDQKLELTVVLTSRHGEE